MSFFAVTVDTESDNAWTKPEKISLKNFDEIPKFQSLCEKFDIIPTYLLTYEYAIHKPAISFFLDKLNKAKCEIGLHLHVWSTPPFINPKKGVDIDLLHAFQYEIDDKLFQAKANTLYNKIYENFKIKPTSHRAGRYGIDQRTINWLCSKNFITDTSIVPYNDYSKSKGVKLYGPNFKSYSPNKYKWYNSDSNKYLVEIPISSRLSKFIPDFFLNVAQFRKILRYFGQTCMLRPYTDNQHNNTKTINFCIDNDLDINFMLHSSELALGCSPI